MFPDFNKIKLEINNRISRSAIDIRKFQETLLIDPWVLKDCNRN